MGFLSNLFLSYGTTKGRILVAYEDKTKGGLIMNVFVAKERMGSFFTGDADPDKLKNREVKLSVPKVVTESKEEAERKQKIISLKQEKIRRAKEEKRLKRQSKKSA